MKSRRRRSGQERVGRTERNLRAMSHSAHRLQETKAAVSGGSLFRTVVVIFAACLVLECRFGKLAPTYFAANASTMCTSSTPSATIVEKIKRVEASDDVEVTGETVSTMSPSEKNAVAPDEENVSTLSPSDLNAVAPVEVFENPSEGPPEKDYTKPGSQVTEDPFASDDVTLGVTTNTTLTFAHASNSIDGPIKGRLWIYVHSWSEGISGWRKSVAEVAAIARRLNATVVEPNIVKGRLTVPHKRRDFRLFNVYDKNSLLKFHQMWATAQEYESMMSQDPPAVVFDWCLGNTKYTGCLWKRTESQAHEQVTNTSIIESAIHALSRHENVIIRMDNVWQNSFDNIMMDGQKFVSPSVIQEFVNKDLKFSNEMYALADQVLNSINVSNNDPFAVIHWRAEKANIDYMQCAHYITESQSIMRNNMSGGDAAKFVLMSSLSLNEDNIWGGAKREAQNSTAASALRYLLEDNGFVKADNQLLPPQKDLVVYAVVDLILAKKATAFATCGKRECQQHPICQKCNWLGKFADMALELRDGNKKSDTTYSCWPQS